jgi:hypothetical protein
MPNSPQWEVLDDDLEIALTTNKRHEVTFRLLAFSINVDGYDAVMYFPNHWQRYETWKEVLPPVRPPFTFSFLCL